VESFRELVGVNHGTLGSAQQLWGACSSGKRAMWVKTCMIRVRTLGKHLAKMAVWFGM